MDKERNLEKNEEILQEVKYVPEESENDQKLKPEYNIKKSDTLSLLMAVLTGQLLILVCGASVVWTSPALIKLKSNNTEINPIGRPIETVEVSMIAGIPGFVGVAGTLLLPKLSDYIGRKRHLQIMAFTALLAGVGLAFSKNVIYIIISRCICGAILAGIFTVMPIYLTEICEDHNRTKYGCLFGLFHQVGHFFAFVVGPIFSLRDFTLITTSPALFFLIFSFLMPESPFFLYTKNKKEECKKTLQKIRNNKNEKELQMDFMKIEESLTVVTKSKRESMFSLFTKRENRYAIMLAMLPLFVQHCSGVAVIMTFLAPFFNSAGTSLSGNTVAIFVSITKMTCFTFTSFVVEKFGKKRMLLFSAVATGVPLFTLGSFFYLKHINSPLINSLQWLPLVAILCNVSMYSMGLGPIPMALISELFPSKIRAAATSFILTVVNIGVYTLTTSYPLVSEAIGIHWCVWMFSLSCFIGAVLIYLFLPNTDGKSFNEIQEMLKRY